MRREPDRIERIRKAVERLCAHPARAGRRPTVALAPQERRLFALREAAAIRADDREPVKGDAKLPQNSDDREEADRG